MCGADSEMADGRFGVAPERERELVLGHELLAEVRDGAGRFHPGDLVAATVRRSCGRCAACAQGSPGCVPDRPLRRARHHGPARLRERAGRGSPEHLVAIPPELGRLGVLAEPASVTMRGIRHTRAVGAARRVDPGARARAGRGRDRRARGVFLRLEGLEVWLASRGPSGSEKALLVAEAGARYVSTADTALDDWQPEPAASTSCSRRRRCRRDGARPRPATPKWRGVPTRPGRPSRHGADGARDARRRPRAAEPRGARQRERSSARLGRRRAPAGGAPGAAARRGGPDRRPTASSPAGSRTRSRSAASRRLCASREGRACLRQLRHHVLDLRVLLHRVDGHVLAVARLLVAAVGHLGRDRRGGR